MDKLFCSFDCSHPHNFRYRLWHRPIWWRFKQNLIIKVAYLEPFSGRIIIGVCIIILLLCCLLVYVCLELIDGIETVFTFANKCPCSLNIKLINSTERSRESRKLQKLLHFQRRCRCSFSLWLLLSCPEIVRKVRTPRRQHRHWNLCVLACANLHFSLHTLIVPEVFAREVSELDWKLSLKVN